MIYHTYKISRFGIKLNYFNFYNHMSLKIEKKNWREIKQAKFGPNLIHLPYLYDFA